MFVISKTVSAPPQPPKLFRKPSIEREIPQFPRGSPALDSGAGSSRSNSTTESATIYDAKPIEYCKQIDYCKPMEFCKPIEYGKHVQLSSNQRLPGNFVCFNYLFATKVEKYSKLNLKFKKNQSHSGHYSDSYSWYFTGCTTKWYRQMSFEDAS